MSYLEICDIIPFPRKKIDQAGIEPATFGL